MKTRSLDSIRKMKWRAKRREVGGCIYCAKPAIPGKVVCEKHRVKRNSACKKRNIQRVKDSRCFRCGRDLDDGMLSDNKNHCLVCQDKMAIAKKIKG